MACSVGAVLHLMVGAIDAGPYLEFQSIAHVLDS
jgi:hypothetical protein